MNNEKLSRIVGLRLLAIKEGAECGAIREVVLDVDKKTVEFLVLDTGKGCFGFCVLPAEKIAGMGKDFAITESSEYVGSIWLEEKAMQLAYTDSDLIGARVVSSAGDVIGKIVDFEFCLDDGTILRYIMEDGGVLPGESIVTLSRGIVFVDTDLMEATEGGAQSDAPQAEPAAVEAAPVKVEPPAISIATPVATPVAAPAIETPATPAPAVEIPVAPVATPAPVVEVPVPVPVVEVPVPSAPAIEAPAAPVASPVEEPEAQPEAAPEEKDAAEEADEPSEPEADAAAESAAEAPLAARLAALRNRAPSTSAQGSDTKSYFEKRRAEYVIGKTVRQQIKANDGTVLVEAGEQVTAEIVEKVTAADKLTELTMGVS